MALDRSTLKWNGWGPVGHDDGAFSAPQLWRFLDETLGAGAVRDTPAATFADVSMPPSSLSFGDVGPFQSLGCEVSSRPEDRAFHARGDSYRDLLDLRAGMLTPAPDAVVYPRDRDACARVVEIAAERDIAIVPFGGGTSVVGGVSPLRGARRAVIALDVTRMNRLVSLDRVSMTATAEAGIHGPDLEAMLQAKGVTLGHYPQSFEFSTLGGWIAARGAGQQSNRYGKAEDWLVSARLATPRGLWATENFPASAAGPRLTDLVVGSEGVLGVVTDATFVVHDKPTHDDYRAWLLPDFRSGCEAVREIVQAGLPVSTLRLSDEDETYFYRALGRLQSPPKFAHRVEDAYLKLRGFGGDKCALIAGVEGDAELVAYTRARLAAILRRHGALHVGAGPARKWRAGRFHGPYLRDPLMDRGIGVDTLETATDWSRLPRLYAAVREALATAMKTHAGVAGGRGLRLAHISHSYRDGASLYFTYVWPRAVESLDAAIAQWRAIKAAASEAIAANGGTISHHHGVGVDHAPWMAREKGEASMEALRALKRSLDPNGVMNPGKMAL